MIVFPDLTPKKPMETTKKEVVEIKPKKEKEVKNEVISEDSEVEIN